MKKIIFLLATILITSVSIAQNIKFGKVSLKDVKNNSYVNDTTTGAVILHKSRNTYYDYDHPDGYIVITKIHKRIKILSKDGLDYATEVIDLYEVGGDEEKALNIKGITYNVENGKLKTEKLTKSGIFKNKVSDYWNETSFTMPNVKVGSIVEWTYKISSPFFWKINDLVIQEDIPTAHYYAKVETLSYFRFNRMAKGVFSVRPKEYEELRNLNVNWEQSTNKALTQTTRSATIQTKEYVTEYELRDIPALKEEPYVDNVDNYRFMITYELKSTEFPNSGVKAYSTTWEKVVKTLNESRNFGDQLKKTGFLKDDVTRLRDLTLSQMERTTNVFDFIKTKMSWNGKKAVSTRAGLNKAYKEHTGNSAQINLMLVALLRECGIKANPVLVSTRDHGFPVFPTLDGFNYVIACAEIGGKDILLDATEKLSVPGILPERALNWEGTLVLEDGRTRKIDVYPKKASQRNTILNVTLNSDGSLEGTVSSNYTDMEALKYRKNRKKYSDAEYTENLINTYDFDDLYDVGIKNRETLEKPITESFSFELDEGADVIGDDIYLSPLLFLKMKSNPFKLETRDYPINFVYPHSIKRIVNIKIPDGYEIKSIPDPIRVSLSEEMGSFLFNISKADGSINVITNLKINRVVIPAYKYLELKEFFNQYVKKVSEKVVLTKT